MARRNRRNTALQPRSKALSIEPLQRYEQEGAMPPSTVEHPYIRINGNSVYSRHGDTVSLFVDRIDNLNDAGITSGDLALQLWACETPYSGGPLTGWKLAEHPLGPLWPNHYLAPVKADVQAVFPESGDYAVALVVAEWDGEGYNRVHDFHNYPSRDLFLHPRFAGSVGYHYDEHGRIVVEVKRIESPRDPDNLSGTLALELWALPEPYAGGAFAGHALAAVTLGTLRGGESWQECAYDLQITAPPPGAYALALMLREWAGEGYVTRDYGNLADAVTFPIVAAVPEASETVVADVPPVLETGQGLAPQPATEAAGAGGLGGAADEAEPAAAKDTQPVPPAAASHSASFQSEVEKPNSFLKRAFEWLKKNFSAR
jgi:hypothetical protein